jgi:hypothetical protein
MKVQLSAPDAALRSAADGSERMRVKQQAQQRQGDL